MDERENDFQSQQTDSVVEENVLLRKVVAEQQELLKKFQAQQVANAQNQYNGFYTVPNVYNSAVQNQVQAQSRRFHIRKKEFVNYVSNALKVAAVMLAVFMFILAVIAWIGSIGSGAGFVVFLLFCFIGFIGTVMLLGISAMIDVLTEIKDDVADM